MSKSSLYTIKPLVVALSLALVQVSSLGATPSNTEVITIDEDNNSTWLADQAAYSIGTQKSKSDTAISLTINLPEGSSIYTKGDGSLAEGNGFGMTKDNSMVIELSNAVDKVKVGKIFVKSIGISSKNPSYKFDNSLTLNFSKINEIILAKSNDKFVTRDNGVDPYGYSSVFLLDGAYRANTSYFSDGNIFQKIGSANSVITKLSTADGGKGFAIALRELSGNRSQDLGSAAYKRIQEINGEIQRIGDEEKPFEAAILADFMATLFAGQSTKQIEPQVSQRVNKIGDIYVSEGGIVVKSGMCNSESWKQVVNEVGNIYVNSLPVKGIFSYPVISGISTQSGSSGATFYKDHLTEHFSQTVGLKGNIEVDGPLELEDKGSLFRVNRDVQTASTLKEGTVNKFRFRSGISNLGGSQNIRSLDGVSFINVGSQNKSDLFNFAIIIYPELMRNNQLLVTQAEKLASLPITTKLEGNFTVKNGNVAVLGQMQLADPSYGVEPKNTKTKLQFNNLANKNNKFVLGDNSRFFVTDRSWDTTSESLQRHSEGSSATLSVGEGDGAAGNYSISLPSSQNFLYVDGNYVGNGTFVLGAVWDKNQIKVNTTPIIIKNIEPQAGSASHLNLSVDVTNALDSAGKTSDIFNSNPKFALSVMNQAAQSLIIGNGTENLELGGLDIASATEIGSSIEIDKNLALKNPDLTSVLPAARRPAGYVTLSYKEGLITPAATLYAKYYFDDKAGTGKDIDAILDRVENELIDVAQSIHVDTPKTRAIVRAATVPDDIVASYGSSGVGSVVSDQLLDISQDDTNVPEDPNKGGNDSSNPPKDNNPELPGDSHPPKGTTSTMDSIDALGMANYFIWRQENQSLYQRMGEVRDDLNARGLWVKLLAGRNKYSENGNYFKNDYYGFQLGLDRALDEEWTLGLAGGYISGKGKLTSGGTDDNWLGSVSVYALGTFEDGSYLDVVVKASRIHNDFTVVSDEARYITKGKRNGNAYSASVEYGQKIPLNLNWYVDPQIQVTYGHIQGIEFRTKNDLKVTTDRVNSLIGRVGIGVGHKADKSNVFVRVDCLRDFTARYDTKYSLEKAKNSSSIDLRDTWGEINVGANFQLKKNAQTFIHAKHGIGGKLKQDYRFDVGFRYIF